MAEQKVELGGFAAGTEAAIKPSFWNAIPYFVSLPILPLVAYAAIHGGWWIAAPFLFFMIPDVFDPILGMEERNMDPKKTNERQMFWYKLAAWLWAVGWPITLAFSLWQILVIGHLSAWEVFFMAMVLTTVAQPCFIIGHEMVHRRSVLERRIGEFLLASASYPHYATEHIYVHHALACTPGDSGSAPKGKSFWRYLPMELKSNLVEAWRCERDRLIRCQLPGWHYTNPFWRYFFETAAWYALVYWMGGPWALLVYIMLCGSVIFSMKAINYVQHYGLRRIRLPSGRYERVQPRHSWNVDYKLSNWFFYNMQRHSDHHAAASRRYPLLQHYSEDEAPQLPGSYMKMFGLAMFPRLWFRAMDPLVDSWRAHFYPQVHDWGVYDSPATAAHPESFETIDEILSSAPRLAAWINRAPELLDNLQSREFTDLDLPDGFGPDPEFEKIARRGRARVYWTLEFGVVEMKEQIAEIPVQDVRDAVQAARNWSNDKVFQVGVHTMRGNLSPVEAGTALSNVTEASIATVLSAVEEDFVVNAVLSAADEASGDPRARGGVAVVVLGDLASRETAPGADLDVTFVYDGGPAEYYEALCQRFLDELRALSRDSLLFAPNPRSREVPLVRSLSNFVEHHAGSTDELLSMTRARCIFTSGDAGIAGRFDEARREILADGAGRDALIAELRQVAGNTSEPGLLSIDDVRGGLWDVELAARFLQLTHTVVPDDPAPNASSIFKTAGSRGLIPVDTAARLAEAAKTWRNLRGVLRLVAENGFAVETAGPKVKAVIAQACEMDDFDALPAAARETAARAATDVDALDGMTPSHHLSTESDENLKPSHMP